MCWISQSCIWEPSFLTAPPLFSAAPPGSDYNEQLIRGCGGGGGSAASAGSVISLHFIKTQTKEVEAEKEESSALRMCKSLVAIQAAQPTGWNEVMHLEKEWILKVGALLINQWHSSRCQNTDFRWLPVFFLFSSCSHRRLALSQCEAMFSLLCGGLLVCLFVCLSGGLRKKEKKRKRLLNGFSRPDRGPTEPFQF